uniref:Uncharacterized protein n=1 Tax=Rousettus aegyptiacus TaxID=9407 RepID=A0A7J8GB17_ROUAE|nr:hypothetical protein HJG63_011688 [Rousettus aegyptiacus]
MLQHTTGSPFLGGGDNKDEGEASPHLTSLWGDLPGPQWGEGFMDSLQTCRQLPTSFPLSLLDLPLVSELPKCWGGGRGRGDWSKNVEMEGEGREGQTKKKGEKRRGEGRVMGGREGSEKPWKEKKEREDEGEGTRAGKR